MKEIICYETTVVSDKLGYAGTLDTIVRSMDNKIWLLDYKTSKNIYNETSLQLTGYKNADYIYDKDTNKKYELPKSDHLGVVHLKPDGTFSLYEYKENLEVFTSALNLYRWLFEEEVKKMMLKGGKK